MNQAKIMEGLEDAVTGEDGEFIYRFLDLYGFPKATITHLRKGTGNRNVAEHPDAVALKNQVYFLPIPKGENVHQALDDLMQSGLLEKNKNRFAFVTDFETVTAFDRRLDDRLECAYTDLHRQYAFFLPLAGQERVRMHTESVVDEKAADKMGRLCDLLRDANPIEDDADRHALNVFLARLLFCLFAEDTGIFRQHQFTEAFLSHTAEDASNAHAFLREVFRVLNTPEAERGDELPAHLNAFPYVNGGLFRDDLPVPKMGGRVRRLIRDAGTLDWSEINPDIFGSMFQAVIDPAQRGTLGQHYTSVSNIKKVLYPLFLDDFYADLEKARGNRKRLNGLLERLHRTKIFDPACGSGAFLIIAYKELRQLEMAVFKALDHIRHSEPLVRELQDEMFEKPGQLQLSSPPEQREIFLSGIRLSQFYGIEIDDFAHEIALLALWLAEHQMHTAFEAEFGHTEPMLPLKSSGNIVLGNALRLDWMQVCPPGDGRDVYVCGNPPFLGHGNRNDQQLADMEAVLGPRIRQYRSLDFVACWFWKGTQYLAGTRARMALVSTSSIAQGKQAGLLWPEVLDSGVRFDFAYHSFPWSNQAKGNAGVHVVIIGLASQTETRRPRLFTRGSDGWLRRQVDRISPYLTEGPEIVVRERSGPFRHAPPMLFGNMPNDGGHLLLTPTEKDDLLQREPGAEKWVRQLMGADEFIKGKERWCLWLVGATEADIDAMPTVRDRIERVRSARLVSTRDGTRELAERPHLFGEIRQKQGDYYLIVPAHTGERREYVPIGMHDDKIIATNAVLTVPHATPYEFGLLSSAMHMDWLRLVGGRLESRYRYSATLVYNTFPWPEVTPKQRENIERLAEEVLLTREESFERTLAEMYDPDHMPERLRQAHRDLDEAVERLYRDRPFRDMAERQEYLLARYAELVQEEQQGKAK